MRFRITFIIAVICLAAGNINAQDWQKEIKDPSNFFSIQKAFYEEELLNKQANEEEEDGPNELYQRWANFMMPRVYPDGKPFDPDIIYKEWNKYVKGHPQRILNKQSVWQYAGPDTVPAKGGGTGRINCIKFNPKNSNIVWAGTPSGGLWKSTNGGRNWSTNTDSLPNLGITDIAIDPQHPDTMYIATGDGFGYASGNGQFFGGYYSNGLMKSTNGGASFFITNINWAQSQSRQIFKLLVHPKQTNIVYALTNTGLWKSKDWGNTWAQQLSGNSFFDIKVCPSNSAIMYLSGTGIYYSTDTGNTWQGSAGSPSGYEGLVLAVTPKAPNSVYALGVYASYSSGYIYKSTNHGISWSSAGTVTGDTFYGKYTCGFAVAPNDSNRIIVGGVKMKESRDGGNTWTESGTIISPSKNYLHPDHRALEFYPGTSDTIYDGNDGGIYFGIRDTATKLYKWNIISSYIHSLESYGVATANSKPERFFTGAQDNGINRSYNSSWDHVLGGDGMICAVSNDNPNVVYANNQYGYMRKSTNGGNSWSFASINPQASFFRPFNWVTPMMVDPENSSTIYYGGDDLYVSLNGGNNWKGLNVENRTGLNIGRIAICRFNDNYIYTVKQSDNYVNTVHLYMTSNGGLSWNDISRGLPSGNAYITGVAVDKYDSLKVWVTFSGFSSSQKVYYSLNGGKNWINASAGLPNIPVDAIAIEGSQENGVYIGTDLGVFYRSDKDTNWSRYSDGLPNVIVNQMQILPSINKNRVSTYGRGIWEGELAGTLSGIEKVNSVSDAISIYPNPASGLLHIILPEVQSKLPVVDVYNIMGQKINELHPSIASGSELTVDLSMHAAGIYTVVFNYNGYTVVKKLLVE